MPFSHELNDRQSARVIEQAIRAGTPMRLDPHYANGGDALSVQLFDDSEDRLTFRLDAKQAALAEKFIPGQYCQVEFSLNGAVYMVSVHIMEIDAALGHLITSWPKMVQLLERRKFIRTHLAMHSAVTVRWLEQDRAAEASLFNIGGGGLALKISRDFSDTIHVGDLMEAAFELPGLPKRFTFKVSICNKTVASDNASVIVGAQFQEMPESGQAGALDELRRFLATQQQATLAR